MGSVELPADSGFGDSGGTRCAGSRRRYAHTQECDGKRADG
jgi:hypothetical protein